MPDSKKRQSIDTEIVELDEKDLAEIAGGLKLSISASEGGSVGGPTSGP
jgi:hypothetical protein